MATEVQGLHSIAFVTTTDETSAKILANLIITHKLAACVNIIPKITSIYHWDGKINEDSEVLMIIKTKTIRMDDLIKFVRENHTYSVAEVISIPIEKGNPPYLDWIARTVPDKYE